MRVYDASNWSVDDLVVELCQTQELFKAAGCRVQTVPDADTLENHLRDNEVDGSTFLALDPNTLKLGLGINNLGQRMALFDVISLLRTRSAAYEQQITTDGVDALNLNGGPEPHAIPRTSTTTTTTDPGGRKRQKITHITTAPLTANRQQDPSALSALGFKVGEQPTIDGTGEWDHLLRWDKADQRVMEIDDSLDYEDFDSDDEDDSNNVSESAENDLPERQDDMEETEAVPGRSKLSVDQIVGVINQRIEHYQSIWFANKGVAKGDEIDYDPGKMWEDAEATGQRQAMIDKHRNDLAYYRQRLDKYCKEIQDYAGNNVERLRQQCGVLEVTVDSMELSRWLLSIYKLRPGDDSEDGDGEELDIPDSDDEALSEPRVQQVSPTRHMPPEAEIIDLGSPPESSQEDPDSMIINSSPPPEGHAEQNHVGTPDRFHTPSVIAETVEPPVKTPSHPAPPLEVTTTRKRPRQQHGDEPHNASIASARRWRWSDLVDTKDSKRCVTKALQEMSFFNRETIRTRLSTVGKADMIREIPTCLHMLAKNEARMQGVLARDLPKIVIFTKLFLCWWLQDNYFRLEPSKWHLKELQECLEKQSPDPSTFCDYLNTIMTTTFSPEALLHPEQPSQAEIVEISSDDDDPPPKPATQRKSQKQRPKALQHPSIITID